MYRSRHLSRRAAIAPMVRLALVLAAVVVLPSAVECQAQIPYLVKDIDGRTADSKDEHSQSFSAASGDALFFTSNDGTFDAPKLWKSDGTEAGTILVKDVDPEWTPSGLIDVNGTLFFVASDTTHGLELWKSDGTEAGTMLVKDIRVGPEGSSPSGLTNVGGMLFFAAGDDESGWEVWKSDGTEAGTVLVKDIAPGSAGSYPSDLVNVGGTLFFVAIDASWAEVLWRSDGTEAGTVRVTELQWTRDFGNDADWFAGADGTLFFTTYYGALWKTDGTENGTRLVKDLPGEGAFPSRNLTPVNATVFFTTNNASELWRSDGSEAGTIRLHATLALHEFLTNVEGTLFFVADGALWKSDGTEAGTAPVTQSLGQIRSLKNVDGTLYFVARSFPGEQEDIFDTFEELWKSDGTGSGTVAIAHFPYSDSYRSVALLSPVGDELFFYAYDAMRGYELWRTDGTTMGTTLTRDINTMPRCCRSPESFTEVDGTLFMMATDERGEELWKSDGTASGTRMVKDIREGVTSSRPHALTDVDGTLFFVADDGVHGKELWKSNGTEEGTELVKVIVPGRTSDAEPGYLTDVGPTLYFTATDGLHGVELWKSDGTEAGTVMVKDIRPGSSSSSPSLLTDVGGTLFFAATDGHGNELWKSDGTEQGTILVKDIFYGDYSSFPRDLTSVGGMFFFTIGKNPWTGGRRLPQLWKSDGTEAGTVEAVDMSASIDDGPYQLTDVDGLLFFTAHGRTVGSELWKSDGTPGGTVLVEDIRSGFAGSDPYGLIDIGGTLFFAADDGTNGRELWKSDDSGSGTVLVKDVDPGARSGIVWNSYALDDDRTHADGRLVFRARDTLWQSDGTGGGTVPLTGDAALSLSREPEMAYINGTIFFNGDDGTHGSEVWAVRMAGCGDGVVAGSEECDDGERSYAYGETCDSDCLVMPCGRPVTGRNRIAPSVTDALWALRASVAQVSCDLAVCDVDTSGQIRASDALRILKAAVGLSIALTCPV